MKLSAVHGLRAHILILILLTAIPAFLLLTVLSVQRRQDDADRAKTNALRITVITSSQLETLIEGARNLLVGLSQVPDIRAAGPSCGAIVRGIHGQSPVYTVIAVAAPDGEVVCNSVPSPPVNLSDRRHFRGAADRLELTIGDFVIGRSSGKASLNLAYPALDETGALQTVIIAAIDLEALSRLAGQASLPYGSTLHVLDRTGTILAAYPETADAIGTSLSGTPMLAALQANDGFGISETMGLDGQDRLYAYSPLAPDQANSPTVVVGVPSSIVYGPANLMLLRGIIALVVVEGLALLAAYFGGEKIILQRFQKLLGATRRLAAGDLSARTGIGSASGELGELGRAFDVMAVQLQRRDLEHQELERSLEASSARLARESERLMMLHRVSSSLRGERQDIGAVLDEILQSAAALVETCEGATIHLWDEDSGTLRRVRTWGMAAPRTGGDSHIAGGGLVGQTFQAGEPIVIEDYASWPGATGGALRIGVKRAFAVPLERGGRRLGVLMIGCHTSESRPFDAEDVRLVGLLADQAAATLETARLYLGMAAQLRRMSSLTRLNQVIFSTLDRETVLAEIAHAAAEIFEAPFVAFWVLDPETGTLQPRAISDEAIGPAMRGQTLTLSAAGIDESGAPLSDHIELELDAERVDTTMAAWWQAPGLVTYYGIPIVGDDGSVVGLLALYGRDRFRFSDADRELLDSFVALAAVAVRNASLYEAESQARRLAEQANRSKSAFLSRMSHELRTPMNAILGFAQILDMVGLEPQDADAVDHILRAGKHLLGLIDEVLDIERIEAGRLVLDIGPVPVAAVTAELIDLTRPLAEARSVTIHSSGLDQLVVSADQQQLRQILLNLLGNAVKYNYAGGQVTISGDSGAGGMVRISVTDTGPGIAPEQMTYLFEPFNRLGAEASGVQGTGLGLTIARALTEAMGGKLSVASVVGQGTTFTVELQSSETFPRLEVSAQAPAVYEQAAPTPTQRILCVEDRHPNAQLVERSLAWRPNVELVKARTGAQGLALAREQAPAVILADVDLPDMSGAEMLRELSEDRRTAGIPVVVLTVDAYEDQLEGLAGVSARVYRTEPFDVRSFLALVDEVLLEAS